MKTYERILCVSQEVLDNAGTQERMLRMAMKSLIDDMPMEALEEIFHWKGHNNLTGPITEVVKNVPEFPGAIITERLGMWRFEISITIPDHER